MALREQLMADLKQAMLAKESSKVSTIRFLQSEIKNKEIDVRTENRDLTEDEVLTVLQKEAKKRKDNITLYTDNGRSDLANSEQAELDIIMAYLPEQMSADDISALIDTELANMDNPEFKDAIKIIMPLLKGKADGKLVSDILRSKLSQ